LVLAVPLEAMAGTIRPLAPHLRASTLLTDLASVKAPVAELARRHLPWAANCVGAHPMAGSDRAGFAAAEPGLFAGAPCILALSGGESAYVVDRIEEFWQCLGSRTVRMSPEEHDTIAATLSHAPHLIAFAYAAGLPRDERVELAGPGLRDFIRIARANPKLWCEILLMNRRASPKRQRGFESWTPARRARPRGSKASGSSAGRPGSQSKSGTQRLGDRRS
jgi:prephenate dehydrogenase